MDTHNTHNTPTSTHRPTGEKRNQFLGFPVDELEGFRRMAGFGYLVLAIASFVAMSFFITHNFIGTEKPIWDSINGLNWSIGQLVYAFIGVSFAFGFNAFTWFFYQTEYNLKQRVFVFLVAVTFPMFTEIGQSMTRAEQTRHESATTSETFKVMKGRVANAGTGGTDTGLASLLASATAEKAKAETAMEQCGRYKSERSRSQCRRKQEQAIAEAQGKVASYQQTGQEAKNTTSSQLAQDAHTLRELEGDTDFLQPIVKLLMGLGFPALLASFLIAFVIIGSIEVAMSYLGGLLREIKEAMRAMGAEVSSPKVKARLRESPIVSALHSTGEVIGAEMMKAQHGREQARQTITGENKPRPTPEASPSRPAPADPPDLRESGGFKQSEEQRANVEALARGEQYQPRPALTHKEALERVLAVVTKGRQKGEIFTIQEVKKAYEAVQFLEGEDRVPALDLEKVTAWLNTQNRPTPTPPPSAEGVRGAEGGNLQQPSAEGLETAFLEWLGQVRAGQVKPTVKPSVRWISARELVKGIKEIETLAYEWLRRAEREGVIKENPDKGSGKALYVLA